MAPTQRAGTPQPEPEPEPDEWKAPRWLIAVAVAFGLMVAAAMVFAIWQPITVLPRIDVAPGFSFAAADGEQLTSESGRGKVTLYTFAPATGPCDQCESIDTTMDLVAASVAADPMFDNVDVQLVTVALDDATPSELADAEARSGADGERWRWIGTSDETLRRIVVAEGFGRFYESDPDGSVRFDPAYVIVDGNGIIRGEYQYQTITSNSDKLASHLGILANEIDHSQGAASIAYEAAHLFMCYP